MQSEDETDLLPLLNRSDKKEVTMEEDDQAAIVPNDQLGSTYSAATGDMRINLKQPGTHRTPYFIYILTVLSAIGGFLFGYDTGVVSGATLPITEKFKLDTFWKELFVSITVGAAAIFAIVAGILNDRIGRKPTTLLASFVFILGAVLLAAAENKAMLLTGRFILGIGIGIASMTVPIYIAESAPPSQRGQLVSVYQMFIAFGMFIAGIMSGSFCTVDAGWRYMLGLAALPAIVQFIGFLFMPESPRWLTEHGKEKEAQQVLAKVRGTIDISEEFEAIKNSCEEEAKAKRILGNQSVVRQAFTTPAVRRALIIGCSTQLFQQICGINTVMYYSATIIKLAGVSDTCQAIWLACATAFTNFIFTFVGIALVERIGRRALLISSLLAVTISLVFLGVAFQIEAAYSPDITVTEDFTDACQSFTSSCNGCTENSDCGFCFTKDSSGVINGSCMSVFNENDDTAAHYGRCSTNITRNEEYIWAVDYCPTPYSWMAVMGMVLYLASFSPGVGPMPWTINAEIYPLWARSFGTSLATFTNWTFNLLISMTFLSLAESITRQGAFYLYSVFGAIGVMWFYLFLPETRGRTLEEMETLFSGSWFVNKKIRTK